MGVKHFTDRSIKGIKAGSRREEHWDSVVRGLVVRVTPTGDKSYYVVYRNRAGRRRRLRIGDCDLLSLTKAREKAKAILGKAAEGEDPAQSRQNYRATPTFSELCDDFLRFHAEPKTRPASLRNTRHHIDRILRPRWGSRRICDIGRGDIALLLDEIGVEQEKPFQANRVRATVSKMFAFALKRFAGERAILETSPCVGLPEKFDEPACERFLTDEEIVKFWTATELEKPVIRDLFRLLLLLGQRPTETMSMEWSQLRDGVWYIPSCRTKNGKEQAVPLPLKVRAILEGHSGSGHVGVFVARGDNSIQNIQKAKCRIAARMMGVPPWRPYDLRRTLTTGMERLGVPEAVFSSVLNHSKSSRQGVTAVYARHQYIEEKRDALEKWCHHVFQLVEKPFVTRKTQPSQTTHIPWSVRDASACEIVNSSSLLVGNLAESSLHFGRSEHGRPSKQRANSFGKRGSGVGRAIENDAMASAAREAVSVTSHLE